MYEKSPYFDAFWWVWRVVLAMLFAWVVWQLAASVFACGPDNCATYYNDYGSWDDPRD